MTPLIWAVLVYHLASRLAYVGWVGAALRREERAPTNDFARFRRRAARLMNHDGVGFVALCFVSRDTLHSTVAPAILFSGGALLIVASVFVKVWAVRTLGWDAYYWRDFFDPDAVRGPADSGPYRLFHNPMYTIGNLHLYGLALAAGSLPGLGAALFDHVAILLFHRFVELPHVRRVVHATGAAINDRDVLPHPRSPTDRLPQTR